jgi:hypothetical protein
VNERTIMSSCAVSMGIESETLAGGCIKDFMNYTEYMAAGLTILLMYCSKDVVSECKLFSKRRCATSLVTKNLENKSVGRSKTHFRRVDAKPGISQAAVR